MIPLQIRESRAPIMVHGQNFSGQNVSGQNVSGQNVSAQNVFSQGYSADKALLTPELYVLRDLAELAELAALHYHIFLVRAPGSTNGVD
jgi:hypothetical protein